MLARRLLSRIAIGALLFWCRAALAIDPSNILVLYNSATPDGLEIANYYAETHPGVRLLGLNGISSTTQITSSEYLNTIRPQVLSALTPNTDVIVTTKGMPLRIQVDVPAPTSTSGLPTYTDPAGIVRTVLAWKPYSSLESELTRIDTISTGQMMGDQSFSFSNHFTDNPYFGSTQAFSHTDFGTRLTSRLDGFTVSDVESAIDRAQNAYVGPNGSPVGPFYFMVDNDPTKIYGDTMTNLVNNVLQPSNLPLVYDNTTAFASTAPGAVIGYVSHGANQASTPNQYILNGLNIALANGAVFDTWESYNAVSFNQGENWGRQGLIAEWLAKGGTAGVGNVAEPGASTSTVINEDKLFSGLLNGMTFAEAAWRSATQLSWVNTVVGDPLMTWKVLLPGDVNIDGRVDMSDLQAMGSHWGKGVGSAGYGWTSGDLNGDGFVDFNDLTLVSSSWGQSTNWATGSPNLGRGGVSPLWQIMQDPVPSIPEPSTAALAVTGILSLGIMAIRRKSRLKSARI